MKHTPFQSNYRPEFEVVEQRVGAMRLYPHTEQLPLLLRALNLEFYGALPPRLARADQRADAFHKLSLKLAALLFCAGVNSSRPDQLRLFALLDPDLVTRVTLVQQLTEERRRGLCHRFRFYGGEDFFPEIYLSGKRVVFADHVLQRFSTRVPSRLGEDLCDFLLCFYGSPLIGARVGPSPGFLLPYHESLLAFTYKETEAEFFITTCLTINEINSLDVGLPIRVGNLHYGQAFTRPRIRNWDAFTWAKGLYRSWQRKVPLPSPATVSSRAKRDWHGIAYWVRDEVAKQGHGPGSRLVFVDHLPGPCALEIKPGHPEAQLDEEAVYRAAFPEHDWDALFAEQYGKAPTG